LISEREARKRLGDTPVTEEDRSNTNFELYQLPLAQLKSNSAMQAGASNLSESKARPENQHGKRLSPKTNADDSLLYDILKEDNLDNIKNILEKY
jgi:hypothetical protein